MKRDVQGLNDQIFDAIVVGGGIHGAAIVDRLSRSGWRCGLIEQQDFCTQTSAAMQRIIHGGLRYIQHANFKRLLLSLKQRRQYLERFPHLIEPLACLMVTKGHGLKGREALMCAVTLYDLCSINPKQTLSPLTKKTKPQHVVPSSRWISSKKLFTDCSSLKSDLGFNGGVIWHDAYCKSPERVVIETLKQASKQGAVICNYMKALEPIIVNKQVAGLVVEDQVDQKRYEIRTRRIINASNQRQWLNSQQTLVEDNHPWVSGFNLMVPRLFEHDIAVGFPTTIKLNERAEPLMMFVVSQDDYSIIGTYWQPGHVSEFKESQQQDLLDAYNRVSKETPLEISNIIKILTGQVPAFEKGLTQTLDQHRISDEYELGVKGLFDVNGVKFTTAFAMADDLAERLNIPAHKAPIFSPHLEEFKAEQQTWLDRAEDNVAKKMMRKMIDHFGEDFPILMEDSFSEKECISEASMIKAQVNFVKKDEMVMFEEDITLRRLNYGEKVINNYSFCNKKD